MPAVLPSLRQLWYLVELAERLNFTQAAQACFVTQSTLSSGIQELERLLGARLVERDRQHVRLTPVGQQVVARARGLLAEARDLVEVASAAGEPMTGVLKISAIPTVAPFLLPRLAHEIRKHHPRLRLVLREDQTSVLLERVRAAEIDFGLIALPYDTASLKVRELFTEELWLISPRTEQPVRRPPPPPTVRSIDPGRLLLLEEGHCLREHTIGACGIAERANRSGIEASSLVTLVSMVETGLGDALLPFMALHSGLTRGADIVPRRFAAPAPSRTIALVARATTSREAEFDSIAALLT